MSLKTKLTGFKSMLSFDNRSQLILNRLLFPNEPVLHYRLNSVTFIENREGGDANGARDLLTSTMYSAYLEHLQMADTVSVLDLGANNGGFPLMLKCLGRNVGRLACVEMNPFVVARLLYNIRHNFGTQAKVINAAVVGSPRKIVMPLSLGSTSESVFASAKGSVGERSYEVEGRTFDEIYIECFGADHIVDICKIDIEGAEFEVLFSDNANLVLQCRCVFMEIHSLPNRDRSTLVENMIKRGFALVAPENSVDNWVYCFKNTSRN